MSGERSLASAGGRAASISPTTLNSLPSKPGKISPQDMTIAALPWRDRLRLAVPGPGLGFGRHMLDQLEHVVEAAQAVLVAAGEEAVLAEHRAAIGPQPGGPVAVQRIVPGLQLAGGAVDAVAALGLVERLHRRHVLVHGRRHLEPVLVEQVLAVHQDEDRDVVGNADQPVAYRSRCPAPEASEKSFQSKSGKRQIALAIVELARIDGVADEERRPGLVEVIEVVGAGLALGVGRDLLQDLLQRHDLDIDLDARVGGELFPGQLLGDDGGRRRLGDEADLRALVLAPDVAQPFGHVCRSDRFGRAPGSRKAPGKGRLPPSMVAAKLGQPDPGDAEAAQELALADAPFGKGPGAVRDVALAVVFPHCGAPSGLGGDSTF